jgi:hypothetical protein
MTARNIAAKQLQALISLRATKKRPDAQLDHMIRNLQVKYGWVKCTTVAVNEPAKEVRPCYRKARNEVMALVRPR